MTTNTFVSLTQETVDTHIITWKQSNSSSSVLKLLYFVIQPKHCISSVVCSLLQWHSYSLWEEGKELCIYFTWA